MEVMDNHKKIKVYLNYEDKIIELEEDLIFIETKQDGEIVVAYNHTYIFGEGKSLKVDNTIYRENYIFYVKDNVVNIYFE